MSSDLPFKYEKIKINKNAYLFAVNIENYDSNFTSYMDKKLVSICLPNNNLYDLSTIKGKILKFLNSKNNKSKKNVANTIVLGYICEFIIHLFFSHLGYKQEFQFLNLEDGGAMKKGFDGVYTFQKKDWYLESKSGGSQNTHSQKIQLGFNDLKDKFSGNVNNNPWFNALGHTRTVNSKKTLQNKIELLSYNFDNKKYTKIEEYNVIPCSTIVYVNNWEKINTIELKKSITNLISGYHYSKINIVCINKTSLTHFKNYLKSK